MTPETVAAIRDYMRPFVEPDPYAADWEGYRYPVSSLYLDSPELTLYRMTAEGRKSRFKLRIRRYTDDPDAPVFLEIKKRADVVVIKRRAKVTAERALTLLGSRAQAREKNAGLSGPVDGEFANLVSMLGARAVIRIRYEREAYESATRDPVRITFDTAIERTPTLEHDPELNGNSWQTVPTRGVVLEIKFTDTFPSWVQGLVQEFQLERRSIPKYLMSMEDALRVGGYSLAGRAYLDELMMLHASTRTR